MNVHLVLSYRDRTVDVEVAAQDPEATVGDLTVGLDGGGGLGLFHDGRWFGPDTELRELGLHDGAMVELSRDRRSAVAPATRPETKHVLAVVGGANAGRTFALPSGTTSIGRDPTCDITIADPTLSRLHARIESGAILDLGSTNGTWLDGRPVTTSVPLSPGALVQAGATQFRVRDAIDDDRPVALPATGATPFNRPPRAASQAPLDPIEPPQPPRASNGSRAFGAAMIAGPILMGAGMVVMYGDPRFALFAALAPVIALVNWLAGRRSARKEQRKHGRAFAIALAELEHAISRRADDERARREAAQPDLAETVRRAVLPSVRLWERRPDHGDFLHLRLGTGAVPWTFVEKNPRDALDPEVVAVLDAHRLLHRAPVDVELGSGGVIGIVGNRAMTTGVARALVCQAAVHHGPADLGVAVVGADEWDWMKWLPHLDRDPFADRADGHGLLVVVDDVETLRGRAAPVRQLLREHSGIVLAPTEDQLPAMCTTVVTLYDDLGTATVRRPHDRLHLDDVHAAALPTDVAVTIARSLARYEDPERESTGAGLPDAVRLLSLLGLDTPTPEAIADRWAQAEADPSPNTPIGVGVDGAIEIDLVRDGPHGLIGGTTGSGKSELLRSVVAGMAARVDPEHLVFVLVDYKGGSAFDECSRLPHVVGLVTDLDEHLAERALVSLEAELRHRERVLRDVGAPDITTYLRAGARCGPLPRLVVVIDEFATMAAELPEFLGALVGIAQRGRSLGVHLLLATQRPSGAVNANIKANTNLRIALRVQDPADSTDIIDTPAAAGIARNTPGRAFLRRGPSDVVAIQTAIGTSSHTRMSSGPIRVRPFRLRPAEAATPDSSGDSELTLLVEAIRGAHAGGPPPRRPWLPMLPEHVSSTDLVDPPPGVVPFALADEPEQQRRSTAGWNPDDGHLALFGMIGSGTTTALLAVVEALARSHRPDECHIYALDFGANGLAPLRALPHVGSVITANEREAQCRLIRYLRDEVERRRSAGRVNPRIVTCIDGIGPFLAEHDGLDGTEVADAFRRVFAEGPAVGVDFVVTADRVGSLPLRLSSLVSQKVLFRMADASDYATIGLRPAQLPRFVPGRAVHSDGNRIVQVAEPGDWSTIRGNRVARQIGTLPTELPAVSLPKAQLGSPSRIPLGVADDDLDVAWLSLHDGDHVLVAGPPRSGKTAALATFADVVRRADPACVLMGICEPRSALQRVDAFDAVGTFEELEHIVVAAPTDDRRWYVLVDDATAVEDGGALTATLRGTRPGLHVIAAARTDDVRAAYGHWLRLVRQSRIGVLLQPDLAADGDLVGVRLPRRVSVPLVPGRGFLVSEGSAALVHLARNDVH